MMIKGINPQRFSSRFLFHLDISSGHAQTLDDNNRMSFGFHRAEVIGALTSVLMIWVVTAILVYMAVLRIVQEDYEIDSLIMLISSAIGILVNVM